MNRVLLLLISVVLLWTAEVSAHAVFLGSDLADGAQLAQVPPSAILRFNEPVSPIAVRLLDADGKAVGGVVQTIASDSEVRLPLHSLPSGPGSPRWGRSPLA